MDRASLKFSQFDLSSMERFLDTWRSDLAALIETLDAKVEDEDEFFTEDDRRNEIAEWLLEHFPNHDYELRWWTPDVIEIIGEWFMNGAGDDLSPETEDWNVWVNVIYPVALPDILATVTTAYDRLLNEGKEDTSGFMDNAPALIRFLAETMEAGDCLFYCHECQAF